MYIKPRVHWIVLYMYITDPVGFDYIWEAVILYLHKIYVLCYNKADVRIDNF